MAGSLFGNPIQIIFGTTGSGTFGGIPFSAAGVTISAFADTDDVVKLPSPILPNFYYLDDSASISISGLGNFQILDSTEVVNNSGRINFVDLAAGFVYVDESIAGDIWPGTTSTNGFNSCCDSQLESTPINTTGGTLVFQANDHTNGFFQATVTVPEPTTWALMVSGLVPFVAWAAPAPAWKRKGTRCRESISEHCFLANKGRI